METATTDEHGEGGGGPRKPADLGTAGHPLHLERPLRLELRVDPAHSVVEDGPVVPQVLVEEVEEQCD
jgi:hypothetical protein